MMHYRVAVGLDPARDFGACGLPKRWKWATPPRDVLKERRLEVLNRATTDPTLVTCRRCRKSGAYRYAQSTRNAQPRGPDAA